MASGRTSFVTGGSGFLGRRVARALVERGDQVRALVRDRTRAADLGALGVELVEGDLGDRSSLDRGVEGADRVFHTAGLVGDWLDRTRAVEVNVEGTRNVLEAAVAAGAARAVHVSSLSVLGTRHHHGTDESGAYYYADAYTDTKIDGEWIARDFAGGGRIEVVVVRPGFVYGPGDRQILPPLVRRLLAGRFAYVGDGGKEMNIVYIDDLAEALLRADETAAAAGQVYNVTDGRNTPIRDFVAFVAERVGVSPPTRHVPPAVAIVATRALESAARLAAAKSGPPLTKSRLRFLYYNQRYSIEKARRELGFEPRFSYREGLPLALDELREAGLIPG